ncbi:MAG: YegP family protein, partial [Candidatus Regiella insecticola]|nr:YegP family protein [Candidatus Regiella insecticola]
LNVSHEPYSLLKAKNHQVIGKSESYSSDAAAQKGIAPVSHNDKTTDMSDLSDKKL